MNKEKSLLISAFSLAAILANVNAEAYDSFIDLYVGAGASLEFAKSDNGFETTAPYAINTGLDPRYTDRKLKDKRVVKPGFSAILGLGKHFKNGLYAGLEGGVDLSKKKDIKTASGVGYDYANTLVVTNAVSRSIIKLDGISYNLGLVFGLYDSKNMFYIKPEILFNKLSVNDYITTYGAGVAATNPNSIGRADKKTAFALAFGLEHKLSNKLGVRFECEYAFPTKIKANNDSFAHPDGTYQLESKINRFKLRALLTYKLLNSATIEDCKCENNTDAFDGLFVGAGIGMNFLRYKSYRVANNVGPLTNPQIIGVKRVFDDQNVNRPFGTVVFGYGRSFVNWAYCGVDALIDITTSRSKTVKSRGIENIESGHDSDGGYVKYKGLTAEIGPRFGYIFGNTNSLVYIRPAALFNKVEIYNDARRTLSGPDTKLSGHPSSVAFAVAIGVEKVLKKNFSVRVEGERVFRRSHWTNSIAAHNGADTGWRTGGNVNGYNARVMLTYRFK